LRKFAIALCTASRRIESEAPDVKAMLLLYARRISPPKEKVWRLEPAQTIVQNNGCVPATLGSPVGPAKPKAPQC